MKKHKPVVIHTSPCWGFSIEEVLTKKAYKHGEKSPLYELGVGLANGKKRFKIRIEEV